MRSYPLDLFFSSWRPSVSHCLGREFRDLLSGLTYLLTWHERGACGRQSGSYPTPFFSPFLVFLMSVVSILAKPLAFIPFTSIGNKLLIPSWALAVTVTTCSHLHFQSWQR